MAFEVIRVPHSDLRILRSSDFFFFLDIERGMYTKRFPKWNGFPYNLNRPRTHTKRNR